MTNIFNNNVVELITNQLDAGINCTSCCWCAYQGSDEQFIIVQKIFLTNPHSHGAPWQCIGCKINKRDIEIICLTE